jgi:hypothetical protein
MIGLQFKYCNVDWHPNAHACRLKLSLCVLHSGEKYPWDLNEEFKLYSPLDLTMNCWVLTTLRVRRYLSKLNLVSTVCRISDEDEVNHRLLHRNFCLLLLTRPWLN